jgi:hypothetical protein
LNINVQLENGYFLYSIGGYTFDDAEELPDETKRIDIAGLFRHVIEDFFQAVPPRPFVEEPWETITIEQKLLFETELQKEIKRTSSSLFDIIKSKTKHIMNVQPFVKMYKRTTFFFQFTTIIGQTIVMP